MRYAFQITSIINRIIAIYEANTKTKSRQRVILLENLSWLSELILIGGTITYILVAILHFLNPIYGYFWKHEFKALMPMYILFIDEKTAIGFTILLLIQSMQVFAGVLASAAADFIFMILVINAWIFATNFKDNVNEMSAILRKKKVDMPLASTKLRNIFDIYYEVWM